MFSTDIIYEVVTFSIGDTKSGTKMGKLQLKDPNTNEFLNCILWEEALNRMDSKLLRCGNQLRIVSGSFNEKYNNCLVNALELIKEAKTGIDKNEQEKIYQELMDYANRIQDEKLRNFVTNIYQENKEKILVCPAAKMMHHNYIGGLMIHTLECLKYAEVNLQAFFQKLNTDEVFAACLLHDIGKIFEYKVDLESGLVDYEENFRKEWISHSQYGFTLCKSKGFDEMARMIAAHHGRADWGAMIDLGEKDLEPELYIIHLVDNLSARFGKINASQLEEQK